ncbi:hypothetical protein EDC01DRAFT_651453 [Geopyxis carbonaria]|nr:hypothetical protein EDC01DRAFT_651453 [Geopyxis carbonaria]
MKHISLFLFTTLINLSYETPDLPNALPGECTTSNLSPGSAVALLVTLAIGCLSHPAGSLSFERSTRAWRLSPVLVGWDTFITLKRLLWGWWDGQPTYVVAHTLLAIRLGNSWGNYQFDAHFSDSHLAREWSELYKYTWTEKEWDNDRKRRRAFETLMNSVIRRHLAEAGSIQTSSVYRLLAWIPMVQAALKLSVVSGAPVTRAAGFLFFTGWLVVEGLLITASRTPLSPAAIDQAVGLMEYPWPYRSQNWAALGYLSFRPLQCSLLRYMLMFAEFNEHDERPANCLCATNESSSGFIIAVLQLLVNFSLFQWTFFASPFPGTMSYQEFKDSSVWVAALHLFLSLSGFCATIFSFVITMPLLFVGEIFLLGVWNWTPLRRLVTPPDGRYLGLYEGREGERYAEYGALGMAVIAVVAYGGWREGALKYDCSSTYQPPYYDWLG